MKLSVALSLFLLLLVAHCHAQSIVRKKTTALRTIETIKIDGKLDEPAYQKAETATDFVQLMPYNGKPSFQPTEVKVLYDDNAIYFGATLIDHPDSIQSYITTRDNVGVSDYFVVFLDPHNEGLNAYEFLVTPANSQSDFKATKQGGNDNEDSSWDAVWQSATQIHEKGWTVEIRIPYSALRFPVKSEQIWGVNFFRRIRRHNSNNSWNHVNAEVAGFIQQSGELYGLKDIQAPVRLSLSPYLASYAEQSSGSKELKPFFKGGLDLKYGLSNSHTLDMMLIPDFGQIQSDDHQLNLSPYELYYSEKRQFFIEGAELFERVGIFYSRRIGRKPIFGNIDNNKLAPNEKISYNPNETQLVNATKISGRDKNGWGIGFLNAMSLPSYAEITDTISQAKRSILTQPFTNYNVSVVEKALINNSYISLINTNLSMFDHTYMANVTGTEFMLKNKTQKYQLTGGAAFSYRSEAENKTGYGYSLGVSKIKGKFRFRGSHQMLSSTYDPTDMGYLRRNNDITNELGISYYRHEPFGIFKQASVETWLENRWLVSPSALIDYEMNFWADAMFRNNWWTGFFYGRNFGSNNYDEPRTEGWFYRVPAWHPFELNANTDNDKILTLYLNTGFFVSDVPETNGYWGNFNIWWKATQQFNFSYSVSTNQDFNSKGYTDKINLDSIMFGNFDRHTWTNVVSMTYNFSTKAKIDIRCRHYWSWADYNQYYLLNRNGSLMVTNWSGNANINYNAFTIDMSYRWQFAPGSELSLVWKNSIYSSNDHVGLGFSENLGETLKTPQSNSLSLRILYYIDYNMLIKKQG
jgi:hypothetical protein